MIISASRRTDIPACYSDWFFKRLKAGFAMVRNPFNPKQVKKVDLSPQAVDGFVFWTKDPSPMIPRLIELKSYSFYFTFTLTSYGKDIEPGFNDKCTLIKTFKDLSLMIGPEKVIWRYDPIILNDKYTKEFHIEKFREMATELNGYTEKCIISFVDSYLSINKSLQAIGSEEINNQDMKNLAAPFSKAALNNSMQIATCCEPADLSLYGITHNKCIDEELLSKISGAEIKASKDRNQRGACGCATSVDIGAYDTCHKSCLYCYANHSQKTLKRNLMNHNPDSPFLTGNL